ncbi:MAG: M1 family metallopeptidase [Sphingomicrobium sp.]
MRALSIAVATLLSTVAYSPLGAETPITADANAPKGRLPDAATPTAYRLDFTVLPETDRFTGHDEIDIMVKQPAKSLYLHGRDLDVKRVVAMVGGQAIPGTFVQVDKTGTARVDFAQPLPAGPATLMFDYSGAFNDSASGMFHVKVADKWYSWTQFESIDARAAFPGFDEPGFKTPFTVSVTTHPGLVVVGNSPEVAVTKAADGMEKHQLAPTRPLPTYLVAVDTGPFTHQMGAIAPTPQRATPMPYGAVATEAQKDKMSYVMAETPRIVSLLENYFGEPFPFPKLDQVGTPIMPGAMENAGADTYGDDIIFHAPGATTGAKQEFGMVVAHELSHQWFGDLVTPAWWDDIWLNESFANWMGYRIGNEWRPELKIGVGALDEGFGAMNTDALKVGRPIHQPINENNEIDSAFDNITYGKGGQVVAMIAAYLGDEKFKDGVRLHLKRHAYGNATSEQFFQSIADAAHDPEVLVAFKSFVDQPGVPLVTLSRDGSRLLATQSRFSFLGTTSDPLSWTIPFCMSAAQAKQCMLLDKPVTEIAAPAAGPIIPNVGGTGYYRFDMPAADWQALIGASASLAPGDAMATTDSLWASFRAGRAPASWLIDEARAMVANPSSSASVDPGSRLTGWNDLGMIPTSDVPAFRTLIKSIYAPRLDALGFDPAFGAHQADSPEQQQLRQQLVTLIAFDAKDLAVRAKLKSATSRYLAGDAKALDPSYLQAGLAVAAQDGGMPMAKKLIEKALSSEDPTLRQAALYAAAMTGRAASVPYLLGLNDKRLRSYDRLQFIYGLINTGATSDAAANWILANYGKLASGNGVFLGSRLPSTLAGQCSAAQADRMERVLGPEVAKANTGMLSFQRTVERVRNCGILKKAKSAEIGAAIRAAAKRR